MNDIIGHSSVKEFLKASVSEGKISHAYIFEGPIGVGKLSCAKAFSEEIAQAPKKMSVSENPDIVIVTNEYYGIDKEALSIEAVRKMKADVYIKPAFSKRKIYIIPNADRMQTPAQNSLLKIFEEPPDYCTIILIAENADLLLQTILSRAVKLRFKPLEISEVKNFLLTKGIDDKKAEVLAIMSKGSIGKALEFSEDGSITALRETVLNHLFLLKGSHIELYNFIRFLKQNEASIKSILGIITDWSTDILHCKLDKEYSVINADRKDEIKKFCSVLTREAALKFNELVIKYSLVLNANTNYTIAVQSMAMEYWEEIHGRNYRSAF